MKWYRFDEKLPPLDTQILIILERPLQYTSNGMNYFYSISSGELSLEEGLRVDSLAGRVKMGYEPFLWTYMVNLPFDHAQKEKLSEKLDKYYE